MKNDQQQPALPKYTLILLHEMSRFHHLAIRGRDGYAEQSGISVARFEEIIKGDRPSHQEHKKICRAIPRMRHYQTQLLEWEKMTIAAALSQREHAPSSPQARPVMEKMVEVATKLVDNMIASDTSRAIVTPPSPVPPPPPAPPPPPPPEPKPWAGKDSLEASAPMMLGGERFGTRLMRARKAMGATWETIATAIGTEPSTIGHWERGTFSPRPEMLLKLMKEMPGLMPTTHPLPSVSNDFVEEVALEEEETVVEKIFTPPVAVFGERLREARIRSGRKVPIIASEMGVASTTFYDWETGHRTPTKEWLQALTKRFPELLPQPPPATTVSTTVKKPKRKIEWRAPTSAPDDVLEVEIDDEPETATTPKRSLESFRLLVTSTKRMLKAKRLDETVRDLLCGAEESGLTLSELTEIYRATRVPR